MKIRAFALATVLLVLTGAAAAGCGQRVYPAEPAGKIQPSNQY